MRACEAKGDFSFVYAAAPRDRTQGRTWRPDANASFEPVLAWHTWGDGQAGSLFDDCIVLEGMALASRCALDSEATASIAAWLEDPIAATEPEAMPSRILARLRSAGFSGCGESFPTPSGYVFPWEALPEQATVRVAIATGVRMVHGAPCLLLAGADGDVPACLGVGMFVGRVPEDGASLRAR